MQPTFAMKDLDEKIAARKAMIEPEGAMTKKLKIVDSMVASCSTPFYCGDSITLADAVLLVFIGMLRSGCVLTLLWKRTSPVSIFPLFIFSFPFLSFPFLSFPLLRCD